MKKLVLLLTVFGFLAFAPVYASQSSIKAKNTTVKKVQKKHLSLKLVKETKKLIKKAKSDIKQLVQSQDLRKALILMVVGLVFLILASAFGGSIVWAVGAIFFLLGALLLLLYLI